MEKELGVTKAREMFGDLVDQVQYQGDFYIISRHGKPAAAVVPIEIYENWKAQRTEFFDTIRKIQERVDLSAEEAEKLAAESVAAVRRIIQ